MRSFSFDGKRFGERGALGDGRRGRRTSKDSKFRAIFGRLCRSSGFQRRLFRFFAAFSPLLVFVFALPGSVLEKRRRRRGRGSRRLSKTRRTESVDQFPNASFPVVRILTALIAFFHRLFRRFLFLSSRFFPKARRSGNGKTNLSRRRDFGKRFFFGRFVFDDGAFSRRFLIHFTRTSRFIQREALRRCEERFGQASFLGKRDFEALPTSDFFGRRHFFSFDFNKSLELGFAPPCQRGKIGRT